MNKVKSKGTPTKKIKPKGLIKVIFRKRDNSQPQELQNLLLVSQLLQFLILAV